MRRVVALRKMTVLHQHSLIYWKYYLNLYKLRLNYHIHKIKNLKSKKLKIYNFKFNDLIKLLSFKYYLVNMCSGIYCLLLYSMCMLMV